MKNQKTIALLLMILIIIMPQALSEFDLTYTQNTQAAQSNNMQVNTIQNNQTTTTKTPQNEFIVTNYNLLKDFSVSSKNAEINLCACDSAIDKITIQNTGRITETYTISIQSRYSSVPVTSVTLNAGEKKEIPNLIQTNCHEDSEDIITTVESSNGISKELTQSLNILSCNNINITKTNMLLNTTPCKAAIAKFEIQNPLTYTEEYSFDTDLFPDYATFSQNLVTLKPKEKKEVLLNYNLPCKYSGNYDGAIEITTKKSELTAELPLELNILKKYDYTINLQSNANVCNYAKTKIPVKIKNNENFTNTYELKIPYNKWFYVENKTLELSPFDEKIVYIIAYPKWKIASPTDLKLYVKSKLSGETRQIPFVLNVLDCYKFDVKQKTESICENDKSIDLEIKNIGTKNADFEATANTKYVKNITPKYLFINSNESKNVKLELNNSKTSNFNVYAYENSFLKTVPIKLNVLSLEKCYNLGIGIPSRVALKNKTFSQTVNFTNLGLKEGTYNVYTDYENAYFDDDYITTYNNSIAIDELNINPKDITHDYKVTIYATNIASNITYTKSFILDFKEKSFFQIIKENYTCISNYVTKNFKIIMITIAVTLLIIILIVLIRLLYLIKKKRDNNRKKLIVQYYKTTKKRRR